MIGAITAGLHGAPFTVPTAPPVSGYSLWLDGNDDSSFTYSSGTVVSQWNDKSGNSRHFTQPTVANQPNRNVTQNGLKGLAFQNSWIYNTGYNWSNSAFTAFIVIKYDALATNYSSIFSANGGSVMSLAINVDDTYAMFKTAVAPYPYNLAVTSTNADVAVWKSAGVSGGNITTAFWKNNTAASGTQSITSLTTGTGAVIGASSTTGGDSSPASDPFEKIFEIVVYPSQLSDTDRNSVEGYLKTKWGTP